MKRWLRVCGPNWRTSPSERRNSKNTVKRAVPETVNATSQAHRRRTRRKNASIHCGEEQVALVQVDLRSRPSWSLHFAGRRSRAKIRKTRFDTIERRIFRGDRIRVYVHNHWRLRSYLIGEIEQWLSGQHAHK